MKTTEELPTYETANFKSIRRYRGVTIETYIDSHGYVRRFIPEWNANYATIGACEARIDRELA